MPSSLAMCFAGYHAAGRSRHRDLDRRVRGRLQRHLAAIGAHDDQTFGVDSVRFELVGASSRAAGSTIGLM